MQVSFEPLIKKKTKYGGKNLNTCH